MATFNLIRNSRVFFTTNVASGTGVINPTGFTPANTQELNVLDGFTFTQASNADTITISESGNTPSRGQRAFNTSLNPVDFSFSTYMKPTTQEVVRAEESVLWNALLGTVATTDTGALFSYATLTAAAITAATATTSAKLTLTGTTFVATGIAVGDLVQLKGCTGSGANELNTQYVVTGITTNTIIELTFLTAPVSISGSVLANFTASNTVAFHKASWLSQPVATGDTLGTVAGVNVVTNPAGSVVSYAEVSTFKANANQLLTFGLIIVVDNITYLVDNCALDQASIDFGLDAIAMVAWTGKATALRQMSTSLSFTAPSTTTTNLSVTNPVTVAVTLGSPTVTLGSNYYLPVGTVIRQGGDIVGVVTTASGTFAVPTSTATLAANATRTLVAGTTGAIGTCYFSVPTVIAAGVDNNSATFTGSVAGKFTNSNYITNKLSTITLVAGISGSGSTSYTVPITGGSIQISNNINYITPANLGVVNVPIGYYTGTRAITGTLNAYLRIGAGSTSTLLATLLSNAATTAGIEPKYRMGIQIGGVNNATKVEVLANGTSLQIPTVDAQAVLSTVINFTVEGFEGVSAGSANFDLQAVNDMRVRYFSV
jgi:hypothetical protein